MSSAIASATGAAEALGHRLRVHREALGLSQADLATRLGVTQPCVSNWESGIRSPGIEQLVRLAETLRVAVGDLFPTVEAAATTGPFGVPQEVVPLVHTLAQHRAVSYEDARMNAAVDAAMTIGYRLGVAHGMRETVKLIDDMPASASGPEVSQRCREQHADWQATVLDQIGYDLGHHLAPLQPRSSARHPVTPSSDDTASTAP